MSDFIFKVSPNIILGDYLAVRLGQYAKEFGKNFMVIIDSELRKFEIESKLKKSLEENNLQFFIVDDVKKDADSSDIERVLNLAKDARIQGIISVGSEEISNFAKAVCSFFNEEKGIYDFIDENLSSKSKSLPLICLLTCLKDEFIFSNRIPFIDARTRKTHLIKVQNAICSLALYDKTLLQGFSKNQLLLKFLSVFCLSLESYVSQKSNFFTDTIIEKSFELLSNGILSINQTNSSKSTESFLAQSSCLSSLALSSNSFGPISILSLALSGKFKISSDVACAILLPHFIEEVAKYKIDRILSVSKMMKIVNEDATNDEAKDGLIDFVKTKLLECNLPTRLKDLHVSIEQLAFIAENVSFMDIIDGFPRSMNADDLFEILKQAY